MKICQNKITDFSYANFTEDETLWTVGGIYNTGDVLRWGHYLYKYAGINETNSTQNPILSTTQWEYYKATNYYSMIGGTTKDQTENADLIEFEFALNRYDTLAFLNLEAEDIVVEIRDNATSDILFTKTIELTTRTVTNYTQFFFTPFVLRYRVYLNIPFYSEATMNIKINRLGSTAKCGRLVCGRAIDLGITLFGLSATLDTYARTELTSFGDVVEVSSDPIYENTFQIKIPSQNFEYLKDLRKELDFVQVLFIGDEEDNSTYQNLLSYGRWESASIPLDNAVMSEMTLTNKETL